MHGTSEPAAAAPRRAATPPYVSLQAQATTLLHGLANTLSQRTDDVDRLHRQPIGTEPHRLECWRVESRERLGSVMLVCRDKLRLAEDAIRQARPNTHHDLVMGALALRTALHRAGDVLENVQSRQTTRAVRDHSFWTRFDT